MNFGNVALGDQIALISRCPVLLPDSVKLEEKLVSTTCDCYAVDNVNVFA